jgi:nucleoside transporter
MTLKTKARLSVMMFLQFFVWGCWAVTMGTYLNKIGFTGIDIGRAYSTLGLAAILSPFIISRIVDRFFAAEKAMAILHLGGGIFMFWAAQITEPMAFCGVLLLYAMCYMPTLALINEISCRQMENSNREFPGIRMPGTLGWIIAGLVIMVLGHLRFENIEATSLPLKMAAGASILLGIYGFFLPHTPPKSAGKKVTVRDVLGLEALSLLKDRSFAVLLVCSMFICIPLSFYYNFTNLFLNEIGMKDVVGKMTGAQISEIVFLLVMPFFFARLGVKWMLLAGMLAWMVRYALFAFGNNISLAWMLYGGILLHGVCYDFFFVTGQIYTDQKAPVAIRSIAQGLLALATLGFGMFIGANLSGFIVDYYTEFPGTSVAYHAWQGIWIIPALITGVVAVVFFLFFKDNPQKNVESAAQQEVEMK